jgi:hypothetical protein
MATITTALAAIRARLEAVAITDAQGNTLPFRWQGEDGGDLPGTPAAFAYVELENYGAGRFPAGYGGGSGNNLYRNEGQINAFVFVPNGQGLSVAVALAEQVAARLRSFRDSTVSCFSASVHPIGEGTSIAPKGMNSEVNNYTCAVVEIAFHFDQIG